MREDAWYKMLIISMALHLAVIFAFSVSIKRSPKRFDLASSYTVNLTGDIGSSGGGSKAGVIEREDKVAQEKKTPSKAVKPTPAKKPAPVKTKPKLARVEKDVRSISRKKVPEKETTTKEELSRLESRLREMRKRTEYLDVSKSKTAKSGGTRGAGGSGSGLPGAGEGGGSGRPLDLISQQYILGVWEKIKDSWGLPGMASFRKDLETVVTIKIRRDGRIVDINVEKRSGNRLYDESILRVLRSVDPLPPIPSSLNTDTMEIGFRFLPGDLS